MREKMTKAFNPAELLREEPEEDKEDDKEDNEEDGEADDKEDDKKNGAEKEYEPLTSKNPFYISYYKAVENKVELAERLKEAKKKEWRKSIKDKIAFVTLKLERRREEVWRGNRDEREEDDGPDAKKARQDSEEEVAILLYMHMGILENLNI